MGGDITVESLPGKRSTFSFTVKAKAPQVVDLSNIRPVSKRQKIRATDIPGNGLLQSRRALVAEDNLVNQKFAKSLLEKIGFEVDVAENGLEAVEAVERHQYDLVLMDLMMPEMDGLEATAAIRECEKVSGRHLPIIAVTANAMAGDRETCLNAGMDAYVSKPVSPQKLKEAVISVMSG